MAVREQTNYEDSLRDSALVHGSLPSVCGCGVDEGDRHCPCVRDSFPFQVLWVNVDTSGMPGRAGENLERFEFGGASLALVKRQ